MHHSCKRCVMPGLGLDWCRVVQVRLIPPTRLAIVSQVWRLHKDADLFLAALYNRASIIATWQLA